MSRADGVLRVVLTGKWWDMIESGEKLEEYRGRNWDKKLMTSEGISLLVETIRANARNTERVLDWCENVFDFPSVHFRPYHTLVASRGYTARTLTRKIKRIRWGTPRPEWSGDTVQGECFVIELEAAP